MKFWKVELSPAIVDKKRIPYNGRTLVVTSTTPPYTNRGIVQWSIPKDEPGRGDSNLVIIQAEDEAEALFRVRVILEAIGPSCYKETP